MLLVCLIGLATTSGDEVTLVDDAGRTVTVHAKWHGVGNGVVALERASGRLEAVPMDRIRERREQPGPEPLLASDMAIALAKEWGEDRCTTHEAAPFLLVGIGARGKPAAMMTMEQLQGAGQLMQAMRESWEAFTRTCDVPAEPVRHVLPVLIFASDRDFEGYARTVLAGQGLAPKRMQGFYDQWSNRLVLRARECTTFDTPRHEVIHQLAYNTGWQQRLAPIPLWWSEGLATAFEVDGAHPAIDQPRLRKQAVQGAKVSWQELVRDDRWLQRDATAAEAYAQAWAMQCWLYTRDPTAYRKLVVHYGALLPLAVTSEEMRETAWHSAVEDAPATVQQRFRRTAR